MKYLVLSIFGVLIWFNGSVILIQDILFSRVYLNAGLFKAIYVMLIGLVYVSDVVKDVRVNEFSRIYISIWVLYFISFALVFINFITTSNESVVAFLYSTNTVHFYLLASILIFLYPRKYMDNDSGWVVHNRKQFPSLIILLIPFLFAIFGIFQFASGNLYLSERYLAHINHVNVEFISGGVRGISVFSSGWTLSEMSMYFIAYCLVMMSLLRSGSRKKYQYHAVLYTCILVFLISVYTSLIRVSMLQVVLLFFGYYLLVVIRVRPYVFVFSSYFLSICIFVLINYLVTVDFSSLGFGEGLLNIESVLSRHRHWLKAVDEITKNLYLGSGFSVSHQMQMHDVNIVVDNFILSLLLFGGVINAALSLILYMMVFVYAVLNASKYNDFYWSVLSVFYFTVPLGALFMDQHNTPMLLLFITFFLSMYDRAKRNTANEHA